MAKLTPRRRTILAVVAGVAVAGVVTLISRHQTRLAADRTIRWDYLEGEEGSDLQRLRVPEGWLVENCDGCLVIVNDPGHEWLRPAGD